MHEHEYVSEELLCVLAGIAGEDNVLMTEPMRDYTTFHIGGPADVLVTPRTPEVLVKVLDTCYLGDVPVTIVGNGRICSWVIAAFAVWLCSCVINLARLRSTPAAGA